MPLSATNHHAVHDSDLIKLLNGGVSGVKDASKSNESDDDDDSSMLSKQKMLL